MSARDEGQVMSAMATQGDTSSPSPERGEQRLFWNAARSKRKYLSRRGRRNLPAEDVVDEVSGEHWEFIEASEHDGVGLYEWQPPEPEPEPEIEEEDEELLEESDDDSEEESKPVLNLSKLPVAVSTGPQPGDASPEEPPNNPLTNAPVTASTAMVVETEHARLFQRGNYYSVENTETGDFLTLPADEWDELAGWLQRTSLMG